jgi:heat-inducible transcriptional repressor
VALDAGRVLVILVFSDNEVQNRIIQTRRLFSVSELEQTANYLNQHFAGLPLSEIRSALVREMRETRDELQRVLAAAVELSEHAFESPAEDLMLTGQTRLMSAPELSDVERLRELFEVFSRKREILGLLERCMKAQGIRVFIGEESGLAPLDACTVITAPYVTQGKILGVLGVIGPTRMAYERLIPIVKATADLLGEALNPERLPP